MPPESIHIQFSRSEQNTDLIGSNIEAEISNLIVNVLVRFDSRTHEIIISSADLYAFS